MKEEILLPRFLTEMKPVDPMTYEDFLQQIVEDVENTNPDELEGIDRKYYEYKKLNIQRSRRLEKQYSPSEKLIEAVNKVNTPQLWLVITESWCGDSAQSLPIIAKAAALNENIKLRIIQRDKNLHIMDKYLTNGSRSIPVLVAFDNDGNELFRWGPRPKAAQELVSSLKEKGLTKEEFNSKLHLWYARNKGEEIDNELSALISNIHIHDLS